jgi:hypothetical protein
MPDADPTTARERGDWRGAFMELENDIRSLRRRAHAVRGDTWGIGFADRPVVPAVPRPRRPGTGCGSTPLSRPKRKRRACGTWPSCWAVAELLGGG